jgi:hypothetical protein
MDLGVDPRFPDATSDELGELGTVVENEDLGGVWHRGGVMTEIVGEELEGLG